MKGEKRLNKEEIKQLKESMKEFKGADVLIEVKNAIQYHMTINSAEIIVSEDNLIISDQKEQDFILDLFYLEDIDIEGGTVTLELSNDLEIILDH